ncbi:MAG: DUF4831 family protein [Prevotella sp.]|jgi:hypothetical protein
MITTKSFNNKLLSYLHANASFCKGVGGIMAALLLSLTASAQSVNGTSYYLPKAVMRFTVKIEKSQYTPGRFAQYARRYLKKDVKLKGTTAYRLIGMDMTQIAMPDTDKHFTLNIDKKHTIFQVGLADNGLLLAINAEGQPAETNIPTFTPAPKPRPINPKDLMSEEILNAGSNAKMAELTAREIYDIRDSRNQLSRGEADFMPQDGAQLRMMLANLDKQERGLAQLFEGKTEKDTIWTTIDYTPTTEGQEVLFRLSKHLGLVDSDDLAGAPYYINVEDNHTVAVPEPTPESKKEDKNDIGLRVSQPGKITITVGNGIQTIGTYELSAPQFGTIESLSGDLFGKKRSSKIILDPLTGSVKTIEAIPVE